MCWGCLSEVCMQRQKISFKISGKKLVNKYCITRKLLLGDQNMLRSIQTQSSKDKQSAAKDNCKDGKKKKANTNSATVVKKPEMEAQQNEPQAKKLGVKTSIALLKDFIFKNKPEDKKNLHIYSLEARPKTNQSYQNMKAILQVQNLMRKT